MHAVGSLCKVLFPIIFVGLKHAYPAHDLADFDLVPKLRIHSKFPHHCMWRCLKWGPKLSGCCSDRDHPRPACSQ